METFLGTEISRSADGDFVVDKDLASNMAHGRSIEVESAKQGMPYRRGC